MLRAAVERHFEIIGEACSRLTKISPDTATKIPDLPRIIAFRNLLIHAYAKIDDQMVWRILQTDLPILRERVADLLAELDEAAND